MRFNGQEIIELLKRVSKKEEAAFRILYNEYCPQVYSAIVVVGLYN